MSCLFAMIKPTELTTFMAHAPTSDTADFLSAISAIAPSFSLFSLVFSLFISLEEEKKREVEAKVKQQPESVTAKEMGVYSVCSAQLRENLCRKKHDI